MDAERLAALRRLAQTRPWTRHEDDLVAAVEELAAEVARLRGVIESATVALNTPEHDWAVIRDILECRNNA